MASGVSTVGLHELSAEHQQMVLETLRSIIDCPHFRKSKRYPALLEYAVLNTLEGNCGALKERIIGVEVFGRPSNYDPGTDPVVRIAAGEVRKRMAIYYNEHPDARVRIDLPIGGYTAEFQFRTRPVEPIYYQPANGHLLAAVDSFESHVAVDPPRAPGPVDGVHSFTLPRWNRNYAIAASACALVLIAAVFGTWRNVQQRHKMDLWWPVLNDGQQAMVLVGRTGQTYSSTAAGVQLVPTQTNPSGWPNIVMHDVVVVAQTCNLLREYGRDCNVVSAPVTSLDSVHGKSIISIGLFNNLLTQRLLPPLHYQVKTIPAGDSGSRNGRAILDHEPSGDVPVVEKSTPDVTGPESDTDYALIGRFHSDLTDSMVVVIGGLGPSGTNGAGQFAFSKADMSQLLSRAPRGWKGVNFEAVLKVDVVQGNPAPAKVVAAQFW
jgi:hypothetical protein